MNISHARSSRKQRKRSRPNAISAAARPVRICPRRLAAGLSNLYSSEMTKFSARFKLARSAASAIGVFTSLLVTVGASAQSADGAKDVRFALVRSFSLPNLSVQNIQSELFRKEGSNAAMADIIDLNLEFSAEHGKPTFLPPQFAPKTYTIILRFPDGWWTTNMILADSKGALVCRIKYRMFEPKPSPDDFGKYVDWCHSILTAGTLDPSLLSITSQP